MSLYEPELEKQRVQEIRSMRKAVRHEKARLRKEKREKYKIVYKEELAKKKAELQAQKEIDKDTYKSKQAIDRAQRKARARVKPFTPRNGLKTPSRAQLKRMGATGVKYGKQGLSTMDKLFSDKPTSRKRTTKRKTTKRKTPKRKTIKRKTTKRKNQKRKGKTYYCRKCKARHSYTSKVGKKHRRK